jgi:hypothetical protein
MEILDMIQLEWLTTVVAVLAVTWLMIEIWHHKYSVKIVNEIDRIYETATLERDVDIVEDPCWDEFDEYRKGWESHIADMIEESAQSIGTTFDDFVIRSRRHISHDFVHDIDASRDSIPITFLFRTFNSIQNARTANRLVSDGFVEHRLNFVHIYHYMQPSLVGELSGQVVVGSPIDCAMKLRARRRKLVLIFPQFSGEYKSLAVFAELRNSFDLMFVCPLGIQLSWSQVPARHTDTLEEYLPFVLEYDQILAVTWSAGNVPFQVFDRYLQLKGLRHKLEAVIRLDPIGHPTSNYIFYTGVPLPWMKLWSKFLRLGSNGTQQKWWEIGFWCHFGCIGFSYLLKTPHGYTYFKSARFLRCTKVSKTPYKEYHFTAKLDPLWTPGHPFFDFDRKTLCDNNVTEVLMDGFHGLWLNSHSLRSLVFPVILKHK